MTYDEKFLYIQRILPDFLNWQRTVENERYACMERFAQQLGGPGVRGNGNPEPRPPVDNGGETTELPDIGDSRGVSALGSPVP